MRTSEPTTERRLLRAAASALRSYQYGNGATDLAKAIADTIDEYFTNNPAPSAPDEEREGQE